MELEQRSDDAETAAAAIPARLTVRAAVQRRYGPPSVLELAEVELPSPRKGEVLVRVGAASVHPGDYFVMTGMPYLVRLVFGVRRPRTASPAGTSPAW